MTVRNFIGGEFTSPDGGELRVIRDPASGDVLGEVMMSSIEDVARAVAAAKRAFPAWRRTPVVERARVLFRLKHLLEANHEALAVSLTREHGKTLADARGEVRRGMENVEHACGMPTLMLGDTLEDIAPGIDCETIRQPLGVFVGISPYNFPVMIPLWFWPYAVAAGNTFVLKPSEQDPITHQRIVELALEAGLPAGVLNVVHGGPDTVNALLEHPDVAGVSFVGSSAVARRIYQSASLNGKRVQALGGAKNHMIVLPDADYDRVNEAVCASAFGAAGQRCLAGSVVVGVGAAYREMRERVVETAGSLRLGHGLDPDTDMGPVISSAHRARVVDYIQQGDYEGARALVDGRAATVEKYPDGHFLGPTVFDGLRPDMIVGKEEIFGPVIGLTEAGSLEEALGLVQQNPYGNAISLFTTSGRAAREFRYAAGISMIGINIGVAAPMAVFPFGGARASFYGDLKAQGRDAVQFYTDQRVVISRW